MPKLDDPADNDRPAGRVRHDASGRAVWEWAAETGRHAIDSTSRLLKRLELPCLALEDADKDKPKQDEQAAAQQPSVPTFGGKPEVDPLAGKKRNFNPYDNREPVKKVAARGTTPVNRAAAGGASAQKAKDKPGLLARLFGRKR
jgi:hypothetical protein